METLLLKKQKRYRLTVREIVDEIDWEEMRDLSIEERCAVVREILVEDARNAANPHPMTLEEVCRALARTEGRQVTRERCRQIESKALAKCRRFARRLRVNERDLMFERDVRLHQGTRRTR